MPNRKFGEFIEKVFEKLKICDCFFSCWLNFFSYTSGTTGTPKGVVLTHRNVVANYSAVVTSCQRNLPEVLTPDNAAISYLPLSHVSVAGTVKDLYELLGLLSMIKEGKLLRSLYNTSSYYNNLTCLEFEGDISIFKYFNGIVRLLVDLFSYMNGRLLLDVRASLPLDVLLVWRQGRLL